MPDDERDDRSGPGGEGFLADMLRQSTITGTEDNDPEPPEEPPDANRGTTEEDEPDADGS
jgi:hypothetical protein